MDFEAFRNSLSQENKNKFNQIFQDEIRKKSGVILEEIDKDRRHLELLNFCANLFVPGLELDVKTGYKLVLVEPLYSLGIKNFDLGIFNEKSYCLLLVECKHSISRVDQEIQDLSKAINDTLKHRNELEEILGCSINHIEFVLCLPALDVSEAVNEIAKQNRSICVWGFDLWKRELRLFCKTDETDNEIRLGRMHRDKNLNRVLFRGITSKVGAVRSMPIVPSSHMCTLLIHVSLGLYIERVSQKAENIFAYSDIYNIVLNQFQKYAQIQEKHLKELITRIVETGNRKGIFEVLTEDIIELEKKKFRVTGRQTNARTIAENTGDNYVSKNAPKLAEESAVKRFKSETGFIDLNSYMK